MEIFLVILIGFLTFPFAAGQNCSGFKVYNENDEVTNVTCTLFKTEACVKDYSQFPNNLTDGDSVAGPRNFEVREFRRNFTQQNVLTSGATFTWRPPLDTTSRRHTKGFYLKLERVGSGVVICRLIDLQQFDLTQSSDFHFSFEIYPFRGESFETYLTSLTSLPPPTDQEDGLEEQTVFTIQPAQNYSRMPVIYPSHWTTWINVKLHESKGIVEASFGFPSDDSLAKNLTSFYVQLAIDGQGQSFRKVQINRILPTETQGVYNFTNVPSGAYRVQVVPIDLHFNIAKKCQCWVFIRYYTCHTCRYSMTEVFNFTRVITDVSSPTPTTDLQEVTSAATAPVGHSTGQTDSTGVATPPVGHSTGKTDNAGTATPSVGAPTHGTGETDNAGIVAAAVSVSVLAVIVAVGVLVYLHRKKRLTKLCKDGGSYDVNPDNNNLKGKPDKMVNSFLPIVDPTDSEEELVVPQLSRKKVLLLAAEDHQFFTQAVEKLADFLQMHCMCDVTFAPQQMPQLRKVGNSYCWLSKEIDSADYVIIVSSEAGLKLFLAFRKGNGYTKAALGPEGDLFTPAMQHICGKIANNEDVRNVMMVYFEHTSLSCRLPIAPLPSFHYHLPNHLPSFLHHIHGLDKNRMDLSQVNLPLQGNIEELEGGQEWLSAVKEGERYEQLNPRWFEQKFGQPTELFPLSRLKPDFITQESEDSGFTESRNSRELKRQLSSASLNAAGLNGEAYLGTDLDAFTRDDFFAPSICTDLTAYTVPYPYDDKPLEVDDQSISEGFLRLNQQYEEQLNTMEAPQDPHDNLGDRVGGGYDNLGGQVDGGYDNLAGRVDGGYDNLGGRVDGGYDNHGGRVAGGYDNLAGRVDGGHINLAQDDEGHDCISVSSAMSV
ncbi:uncharacterized protein LOC143283523 [Babylonia areolata]|uniref:uncharacterized protein LOC143283523 n=1 Tax=Babylonia areolata TaxID=304850 RepID=UPI003FD2B6ED